jgi:hypothetical protein
MKPKHQMSFGRPSEVEALLLANQAAIATALAFICHSSNLNGGPLFGKALDTLAINTHNYLQRFIEKDD